MSPRKPALALAAFTILVTLAPRALAIGESENGFPSYDERLQHELANRARVDPQIEMDKCGDKCPDRACYKAQPPLYYSRELNHSARFHAAHMEKNGYFAHDSSCTLVDDIATLFPDACDGAASCACKGGENKCNPDCTSWSDRIKLFGPGAGGEIIASGGGPEGGFYLWLYESTSSSKCEFSSSNGHRWLLLTAQGAVGFGSAGKYVGDFSGGGEKHPIASGSHLPRQADEVEIWANWYADAGPSVATVNVDGTCMPMQLSRGAPENGAYMLKASGVGSGCHRYWFLFQDAAGNQVTYPEQGSLGIGPEGSCADWNMERPAAGAGCDCKPVCDGKQCGDNTCGGSCGTCGAGDVCSSAGQCVKDDSEDAGCGCAVPGEGAPGTGALGLVLGLGVALLRRRAARG